MIGQSHDPSTRPRLIVNGDDLGRTKSLTYGAFEAHEKGILTSASLVAGSRHFDLAVSLAKQHPSLGVGVHLVVDEYEPLAEAADLPNLLNADGGFHGRGAALVKILVGAIPAAEVAREWEAQIAKVVDAGLRPTHLDGHGHCHASPTLAGVVVDLARKFDIRCVRLPRESLAWRGAAGGLGLRRHLEKGLLHAACARPRRHWRGRVSHPDRFFGFMDAGRLSVAALERVAQSLEPGVAELMAHPALDNEDLPYGLDYDWRRDFDTLVAFGRAEFEERFGVELVSFGQAFSHS